MEEAEESPITSPLSALQRDARPSVVMTPSFPGRHGRSTRGALFVTLVRSSRCLWHLRLEPIAWTSHCCKSKPPLFNLEAFQVNTPFHQLTSFLAISFLLSPARPSDRLWDPRSRCGSRRRCALLLSARMEVAEVLGASLPRSMTWNSMYSVLPELVMFTSLHGLGRLTCIKLFLEPHAHPPLCPHRPAHPAIRQSANSALPVPPRRTQPSLLAAAGHALEHARPGFSPRGHRTVQSSSLGRTWSKSGGEKILLNVF